MGDDETAEASPEDTSGHPTTDSVDPGPINTVPVMGVEPSDDPGPIATAPLLKHLDPSDIEMRISPGSDEKSDGGDDS